jgi:hypothetical protein
MSANPLIQPFNPAARVVRLMGDGEPKRKHPAATQEAAPKAKKRMGRPKGTKAPPDALQTLRALLAQLPALWGDDVVDGQVQVTINEDAIDMALALLREAHRQGGEK